MIITGLTGSLLGCGLGGKWQATVLLEPTGQLIVQDVSSAQDPKPVLQAVGVQSVCRANSKSIIVAGTSTKEGGTHASHQLDDSSKDGAQQQESLSCVLLTCSSDAQLQQIWDLLQQKQQQPDSKVQQQQKLDAQQEPQQQQQQQQQAGNRFDAKTDKGSADLYFHYYGMLQHQQNMLQDMTRTGTYHAAITENRSDFEGRTVMDVGAGSGILSLFSAQAGARKVYAVEASEMASFARQLAERNSSVGKAVQVCHCKVEELQLPEDERVDVLVSEPMGTLLVNERMLETYLYARDHFLKPGGKMFPHLGRVHVAAFSDVLLHNELQSKALFWQQTSFYGIDMTPLHQAAVDGYFTQVVVDAFDPAVLVSDCASRLFDFSTMKEEELHDIHIPLDLTVAHPCTIHGVATWFDVLFNGSTSQRWLSTAPGLPATHWFQLRCALQQPLVVLTPNSKLTGCVRLVAHERQSYDILLDLEAPPVSPGMPAQKVHARFDMKEPYYRQLTAWAQVQSTTHAAHPQVNMFPNLSIAVGDASPAPEPQPQQQPQAQYEALGGPAVLAASLAAVNAPGQTALQGTTATQQAPAAAAPSVDGGAGGLQATVL